MNVPYYSQKTIFTCGPATTRMVLKYYDISKTEKEIEKELGTTEKEGTDDPRVRSYVKTLGLQCTFHKIRDRNKGLKRLHYYVKKKIPIIVTVNRFVYDKKTPRSNQKVDWESDSYSFHMVVVTNIDDKFVYFNDPHPNVKKTKLPIHQFIKAWYHKIYPGYAIVIRK